MSHFIWQAFQSMMAAGQTTTEVKAALQSMFKEFSEVEIVKILDNQGITGHIEADYAAAEMNRTIRAQVDRRRNSLSGTMSDDQATGAMLEGAPGLNELIRRAAGRG